jgi:predicted nucleic acid-binding protein
MNRLDPLQATVERFFAGEAGPFVLQAPVSAEVDYMVHKIGGRTARRALLTDFADGYFQIAYLEPSDYDLVLRYDEQYADLDVGLADLSIAVLAHRFRTRRILTFDQRHFRTLRPLDGGSFLVLPYDEPEPARRPEGRVPGP